MDGNVTYRELTPQDDFTNSRARDPLYFVKYGDRYLHDPRNDDYTLVDLELDMEENSCGYLDFTIYPTHPMYDKLKAHDYINQVLVYANNKLIFAGYIYSMDKNFEMGCSIRCKGELDYLNQTVVEPFSTIEAQAGFMHNVLQSYESIFEWLIDQHNEIVENEKKFEIGINQASNIYGNLGWEPSLEVSINDFPTTLEAIQELFTGENGIGGYLRIRHENGVRFIDLLKEWDATNSQVVDFGKNLTDYTKTDNSENRISVIYPTGARLRDTDYGYSPDGYAITEDTAPYEDVTYYTRGPRYVEYLGYYMTQEMFDNQSDTTWWIYNKSYDSEDNPIYTRTTDTTPTAGTYYYISYYLRYEYSVFSGDTFEPNTDYYEYDESHDMGYEYLRLFGESSVPFNLGPLGYKDYELEGNTISSPSLISEIGRITAHMSNTEITTREELLQSAIYGLDSSAPILTTIEVKAVDMSFINPDLEPISIGEYVRIVSKPHNLDEYFLCRNISLDLNDPSNSTYVFGIDYATLTNDQASRMASLKTAVQKTYVSAAKLTEAEKGRTNNELAKIINVSTDQDAAITSLFEMIVGG